MRFTQKVKAEKEAELDLKDSKILYSLYENARMPYTRIAKKVALSKDAVKYRIKNLEKKGVIQGYTAVVDIGKLSYDTYHIFLQLNKANKEIRGKLVNTLSSYDFVKVIVEFSGKYTFEIGVAAENIQELDKIITKIIDDVSGYLQEHQILIISEVYESKFFPKKISSLHEERKTSRIEKIKIDKIDLKILKILSDNAILELYKIADSANLSADAINYRIKKMMQQGLILRFVPIVNYSVLGYTIYAILMNINNLGKEKENKLKNFLKGDENVLWAVKTIGRYNLLMYLCTKKSDELHQALIQLKELFSSDIKDYETLIAYEEYKYTYLPEICVKS
jgi:Lrp/AsnC family leucine-responsive transcriptional regulator